MKEYAHGLVALALAVMTLTVTIITHENANVRSLDFARFYKMKWVNGDTDKALSYIRDPTRWVKQECLTMTNLTAVGSADCLAQRTSVRDGILTEMKCVEYNSQMCSYLRRVLQALVYTSTKERTIPSNPTSPFKQFGLNLKTLTPDGGDQTYAKALENAVANAPRIFHGNYRAEQSNDTLVLRSALYTLITFAILGNLAVHITDSYDYGSRPWNRTWIRSLGLVLILVAAIIFTGIHRGNAMVLSSIIISASVTLAYFEVFLDGTIVRPWIHPFAFSIIYQATAMLALVENGVLDYSVIVIQMLFAMATSQAFMAVAWFYVGVKEKTRLTGPKRFLYLVYQTKEVSFGLLGAMLLLLWTPLQQILGPYDYTVNSWFLLLSPLLFAVGALVITLQVQEMHLSEEGQEDSEKRRYRVVNGVADPTAITGGKLYSSLLVLLFGALMAMIQLQGHVATFRAYEHTMPPPGTVGPIDSQKFLMGSGLLLSTL